MNTPLGALETSTTIIERCTGHLAESLDPGSIDGPHDRGAWQRTLKHLTDSAGLMRQATTRLAGLVVSVRSFARLDEAEAQRADLRAGIDSTLSLIPDSTKGAVEIFWHSRASPSATKPSDSGVGSLVSNTPGRSGDGWGAWAPPATWTNCS